MAKDPAFLFYTNDFQSGTQFFTDEQVGKYLRVLMAQHQHGHLTEKQVLFICKTKDEDILSKLSIDDKGLYYNEKLDEVILARKKFTDSRRDNRLGKTKDKKKPVKTKKTSKTSVILMEDEIENENTIVFEDFYKEYPLKKGKLDGQNAWKKLKPEEWQPAIDGIKKLIENCDPKYYPHPATYLNGKRWDDEYLTKPNLTLTSKTLPKADDYGTTHF